MTDKFVVSTNVIGEIIVTDVETDRVYRYDDISNFFGLIRLLNEQQSTIQFLQDEIDELKKDIDIYEYEEKKHSETARKLYEENELLRTQLLICQQSKCDDGRFQVWEMPPIPKGTRITFSTTERSGKNE